MSAQIKQEKETSPKKPNKSAASIIKAINKRLAKTQLHEFHIDEFNKIMKLMDKSDPDQSSFKEAASAFSKQYISAYEGLVEAVKKREKMIQQLVDLYDTVKQVPVSLIAKIVDETAQLVIKLDDFRHYSQRIEGPWNLMVPEVIQKSFSLESADYIEILFTQNSRIIKLKNQTIEQEPEKALEDPNPFLFTKEELIQKENQSKVQLVLKMLKAKYGDQNWQYVKYLGDIQAMKKQESKKKEQIMNLKLQSIEKEQETLKLQQQELSLERTSYIDENFGLLRKYKSLQGSPKKVSKQKYLQAVQTSPTKAKTLPKKNNDSLNKYMLRIEKLKQQVSPKSQKKKQPQLVMVPIKASVKSQSVHQFKANKTNKSFNNKSNADKSKIKLLFEVEHESVKDKETPEIQKAYKMISKLEIKPKGQQNPSEVIQLTNQSFHREKNKKMIPRDLEKEQKLIEMDKSLKSIKKKVNLKPPISLMKLSQNFYFTQNAHDYQTAKPEAREKDKKNQTDYQTIPYEKKSENYQERDKHEDDGNESNLVENKIQETQKKEEDPKKTKLKFQQENLEEILEDIENENIEKEHELSKQKTIIKSVQIRKLENKIRIAQLEDRIREYGQEPSQNSDPAFKSTSSLDRKEEYARLRDEKKHKMAELDSQKESLIKQVKKASERILQEQKRFIQLKQQQQEQQQKILSKNLQKQSQSRIQELELKTQQLKEMIRKQQHRKQINQKQLDQQIKKNQQIQAELRKQEQIEELLISQLQKINKEKEKRKLIKRKKEEEEIQKLKKDIVELQQQQKNTLMEHQRDSQAMISMFEAIRSKNSELQSSIRKKKMELTG